jgi:non-lysosomal glucosylceramidase
VDQLVAQYLVDVGGMGPLTAQEDIRTTLQSIYRYNHKDSLADHDNVERTYALNDEAAVLVCDYGKAERPHIPFPYYAEAWTGLEYTVAALMISWGMADEGIEIIRNSRLRYDGEKRNPWDEAECGHHYARAMSSWSAFKAVSGFNYDGSKAAVVVTPPIVNPRFNCFWITGTGWGTFSCQSQSDGSRFGIRVLSGSLRCRSFELALAGETASVRYNSGVLPNQAGKNGRHLLVRLQDILNLSASSELQIETQP